MHLDLFIAIAMYLAIIILRAIVQTAFPVICAPKKSKQQRIIVMYLRSYTRQLVVVYIITKGT